MAGILDLLGITGGQTPVGTNQTPVLYDDPSGMGSMTAGGQQGALNSVEPQGILDRIGIKTDNFSQRLGNALIAGGSRNPGQVLSDLQKTDAELKSRPKITQIPGTPFFLRVNPDGTQEVVDAMGNPIQRTADGQDPVEKYMIESEKRKNEFAIDKIRTSAQAGVDAAGAKGAQKTAEETRPILNDVQGLKSRWSQAYDIVAPVQKDAQGNPILDKDGNPVRGTQGLGAQVQGMFPKVAGFFGMDEAARNKFLQGLTVDETLLNTARTKGAISNQEMDLFKSPIPALTDDREKVWKPWIEERIKVLDKLEKFYASEIARGTNPKIGGSQGGGQNTAPKTSGGVVQITTQEEWANLPKGTLYKDPNGVVRTKQ